MRVDTKPVMTKSLLKFLRKVGKLITQIIIQNIWIKRREVHKRQNKKFPHQNPQLIKRLVWFQGSKCILALNRKVCKILNKFSSSVYSNQEKHTKICDQERNEILSNKYSTQSYLPQF